MDILSVMTNVVFRVFDRNGKSACYPTLQIVRELTWQDWLVNINQFVFHVLPVIVLTTICVQKHLLFALVKEWHGIIIDSSIQLALQCVWQGGGSGCFARTLFNITLALVIGFLFENFVFAIMTQHFQS